MMNGLEVIEDHLCHHAAPEAVLERPGEDGHSKYLCHHAQSKVLVNKEDY